MWMQKQNHLFQSHKAKKDYFVTVFDPFKNKNTKNTMMHLLFQFNGLVLQKSHKTDMDIEHEPLMIFLLFQWVDLPDISVYQTCLGSNLDHSYKKHGQVWNQGF